MKRRYTPEVIQSARTAAVAMAAFWDEMLAYEGQTGKSFDGTVAVVEALAADCDCNANVQNTALAGLTDQWVRAALNDHLEEER